MTGTHKLAQQYINPKTRRAYTGVGSKEYNDVLQQHLIPEGSTHFQQAGRNQGMNHLRQKHRHCLLSCLSIGTVFMWRLAASDSRVQEVQKRLQSCIPQLPQLDLLRESCLSSKGTMQFSGVNLASACGGCLLAGIPFPGFFDTYSNCTIKAARPKNSDTSSNRNWSLAFRHVFLHGSWLENETAAKNM